jgi:Domain of unknown function (DUF5679)
VRRPVRIAPISEGGTDRVTVIDEEVGSRMAGKEGYCVKCKAKKEMKDPVAITMKNGRPATQGICPSCGTKMFKIGA